MWAGLATINLLWKCWPCDAGEEATQLTLITLGMVMHGKDCRRAPETEE